MIRIILMIGLLLMISACAATEDENGMTGAVVMCNGKSGCCIDQDGNGVCDRDEITNATKLTQRTIKIGNQS